ncbi:MAG: hypothetical protein IJS45_04535 [Clostridia bacterium]|nr:hypothetical protein [Clostridia bacterium]
MTVLEDLWYGNIDPHEAILTGSKRYKHLLSLMARNRDELNETLTDKQSESLTKYDETVNEMHSLAEVKAFSCGFQLGVRLMIEAFVTKNTP